MFLFLNRFLERKTYSTFIYLNNSKKTWICSFLIAKTLNHMISNKKWQELLALSTTGQKLPNRKKNVIIKIPISLQEYENRNIINIDF